MYRLVVNPGSTQRWEMRLKAGANSIGRSAENDFQIEHDSISSLHCVIQVGPGRIVIRDRGSTNGTFLNDRLIHESDLHPGETLQVGAIRMVLEECEQDEAAIAIDNPAHATVGGAMLESRLHLEPVARASSNPSIGPSNSSPAMVEEEKPIQCKNHYQNIARYKCPKCVRYLCDLCVNTRGTAGGGQKFCKICSTESVPVIFKHTMEAVDFFAEARQAFFYPIRGDGLVLLFGGSFFFGFLDLANYVSRHAFQYGLRAMMMRVTVFTFIFGPVYLFAYLKKMIAASVAGDAYMPDLPACSACLAS